jgi:hypothetical protein
MFVTLVASKIVLGIGIGVVFYDYVQSIGMLCLIVGIIASIACVVMAAQKAAEK